jgi:hypothetical protein
LEGFGLAFLDSDATLAEVIAQFENTSHYDVGGSDAITMAREHVQACRILIGRTVEETRQGPSAVRDISSKYRDSLREAKAWLKINDPDQAGQSGGGVRHYSFSDLRS